MGARECGENAAGDLSREADSLSNSELAFRASTDADPFAVLTATMSAVAIKSDGPVFGQAGTSL